MSKVLKVTIEGAPNTGKTSLAHLIASTLVAETDATVSVYEENPSVKGIDGERAIKGLAGVNVIIETKMIWWA